MKSWRSIVGLLISFVFVFFALRGQDYHRIREALSEFQYWLILPALILYFIGVWLRAYRWSVLLRPLADLSANDVMPVTVVGYMANNVLPLRTGELVRSYVLWKRFGVSKTASLATIAVERLFDGITMLGFILIATISVSLTSELRHTALVAFILFAVALIMLFLLTLGGNWRDRIMQIVLGPLPTSLADKVEQMAESFLAGLGVLRRKRDLAEVAGASILAWMFEASMYYVIAQGFGPEIHNVMTIGATLLTTGIANLATLVPSSPGYIGPFEYGVTMVVNGALGSPKEVALSFALIVHATLYFPITVWGAIEWYRQNLSMKQVRAAEIEGNGPLMTAAQAD